MPCCPRQFKVTLINCSQVQLSINCPIQEPAKEICGISYCSQPRSTFTHSIKDGDLKNSPKM